MESNYLMEFAREMMEEVGSTTINTNILWGNQVSNVVIFVCTADLRWLLKYLTMDESVVKFMLATGFEYFDKGVEQKERMLVTIFFIKF